MATTKGAATAAPATDPAQHHAMAPRRGEPGVTYEETDARGITRQVRADADGIVRPETLDDVHVADVNGLPYLTSPEA